MTNPATRTAAEQPTWDGRAADAYRHEQTARLRRQSECAAPDMAMLKTKLAELGITPIDERHDGQPYQVADDGTVTTLIAQPDADDPFRRRVWACARADRLWLRASEDIDGIVGDVEGELHSLADLGRALIEGPQPLPAPATNYERGERQLRTGRPDCSTDTRAICQAIEGLTHAVLAVADELRDGALAAIGGSIERHVGDAR